MQLLCTDAWSHLELQLQVQEGGVLPQGAARVAAPTMAREADAQPWAKQAVDGLCNGGSNAAPDAGERGCVSDEVSLVVEECDAGDKGFGKKHGDRAASLRAASQVLHNNTSIIYKQKSSLQGLCRTLPQFRRQRYGHELCGGRGVSRWALSRKGAIVFYWSSIMHYNQNAHACFAVGPNGSASRGMCFLLIFIHLQVLR